MLYQFEFTPYQRPFKIPLKTHHGTWAVREGIIVTLTDEQGWQGQGEIAPLPWFGTETVTAAIALCESFGKTISTAQIYAIPDQFPACQFGFETAVSRYQISDIRHQLERRNCCQLLSSHLSDDLFANQAIDEQLNLFLEQGFRTFKLKIAVAEFGQELELCQQIIAILSRFQFNHQEKTFLRLDANGGLSLEVAKQWLEWGEQQANLEFIEQPLAPEYFAELLWLQNNYQTKIALDESVTNLTNLEHCYRQGWRGVYVLKVAIAGFPSRLRKLCGQYPLDLVFSTVFETQVGQQALLQIARDLGNPQRALGLGGDHWFAA
jgi:O-succinylbenzoate synthase